MIPTRTRGLVAWRLELRVHQGASLSPSFDIPSFQKRTTRHYQDIMLCIAEHTYHLLQPQIRVSSHGPASYNRRCPPCMQLHNKSQPSSESSKGFHCHSPSKIASVLTSPSSGGLMLAQCLPSSQKAPHQPPPHQLSTLFMFFHLLFFSVSFAGVLRIIEGCLCLHAIYFMYILNQHCYSTFYHSLSTVR